MEDWSNKILSESFQTKNFSQKKITICCTLGRMNLKQLKIAMAMVVECHNGYSLLKWLYALALFPATFYNLLRP